MTQRPTMQNIMIETPRDVLILLQKVLRENNNDKSTNGSKQQQQQQQQQQLYPLCYKRLDGNVDILEKCSNGNVFVFKESQSKMKRWTDKLNWSPSRIIMNKFLIYKQLISPSERGEINTGNKKFTGLCKKTISLKLDNDNVHVVFYYNDLNISSSSSSSSSSPSSSPNDGKVGTNLKTLSEIYGDGYSIDQDIIDAMEKCNIGTTPSMASTPPSSITTKTTNKIGKKSASPMSKKQQQQQQQQLQQQMMYANNIQTRVIQELPPLLPQGQQNGGVYIYDSYPLFNQFITMPVQYPMPMNMGMSMPMPMSMPMGMPMSMPMNMSYGSSSSSSNSNSNNNGEEDSGKLPSLGELQLPRF